MCLFLSGEEDSDDNDYDDDDMDIWRDVCKK